MFYTPYQSQMLTKVYVETKSNHRHHQALPISKILINRVLLAGFRWSAPQWEMGLESGLFWVLQVEIGFCTANTRHCHATRRSNLHLTQNSKNFLKTYIPQYNTMTSAWLKWPRKSCIRYEKCGNAVRLHLRSGCLTSTFSA